MKLPNLFLLAGIAVLAACNDATTPSGSAAAPDRPASTPGGTPTPRPDKATGETGDSATLPKDLSIVPGNRIGALVLGVDEDLPAQVLGAPDRSEAAMGKAWLMWKEKKGSVRPQRWDVYTAYRDTSLQSKSVQLIRSNDAVFTAPGGIGVSAPLDSIGKAFPSLRYVGHFREAKTGDLMSLYDAPGKGIAFEIRVAGEKKRCSAVMVYAPSQALMSIYQSFLNINGWTATREK